MAETNPKGLEENTVGKGEITRSEQFLLFPTVFSKDLFYRHLKTRLAWERIKPNTVDG